MLATCEFRGAVLVSCSYTSVFCYVSNCLLASPIPDERPSVFTTTVCTCWHVSNLNLICCNDVASADSFTRPVRLKHSIPLPADHHTNARAILPISYRDLTGDTSCIWDSSC
jgi:hypothetical protein